jgi:hypothetical protein
MTDAPKQSTDLINLAHERYRLLHSTDGAVYAVPHGGPNIARPLRGGHRSMRVTLAELYYAHRGKAPSTSALVEALTVLEGQAHDTPTEELALRFHYADERMTVDLGHADGSVVTIDAHGWSISDRSDVIFRRTKLTGPIPVPERGGTLDELRAHVNLSDHSWPLARGYLVAACLVDQACPILALIAEQGAAKTTTARRLVQLVDPSPAPLRHAPSDALDWTVMANASRVIGLDNVSGLPVWLSDAVCRAVTGEGFVKRQLYSDGDVAVFSGRRAIILTAIDAGALRGDFADRVVTVELGPITPEQRREDADLDAAFHAAYPRLLGAFYDELAAVLARLPNVRPAELPRMADYGRILATLDQLHGTHGLDTYLETRSRLAVDLVEADPVATAVRNLAQRATTWDGTPTELLETITPDHPGKGWPADATRLSGRLRRVAPALRSVHIDIDTYRTNGQRRVRIVSDASDQAQRPSASLPTAPASLPPIPNGAGQTPNSDAGDAADAKSPTPSVREQEEEGEEERGGITASLASLPPVSDAQGATDHHSSDRWSDDLRAALADEEQWQPFDDAELDR